MVGFALFMNGFIAIIVAVFMIFLNGKLFFLNSKALAGYLHTKNHHWYAFMIVVNNAPMNDIRDVFRINNDLGQVGEVERIDPSVVTMLDSDAFIPVIAPIGVGVDGQSYNINADLVAGKLAAVLGAEKLLLLTNTPGVLNPDGELLTGLGARETERLIDQGVIHGGMLPKVQCAISAINEGVGTAQIIDGRVRHSVLLELLTDSGVGTLIRRD